MTGDAPSVSASFDEFKLIKLTIVEFTVTSICYPVFSQFSDLTEIIRARTRTETATSTVVES